MQYKLTRQEIVKVEKLQGLAAEVAEMLTNKRDSLQDQYDGRPESWQDSDRGQAVAAWLDALDDYTNEAQSMADADIEHAPEES